MQKQQEYEELKECTFKPQIKGESLKEPAGSLQEKVKGLDKFMQNKENLKRMQVLPVNNIFP